MPSNFIPLGRADFQFPVTGGATLAERTDHLTCSRAAESTNASRFETQGRLEFNNMSGLSSLLLFLQPLPSPLSSPPQWQKLLLVCVSWPLLSSRSQHRVETKTKAATKAANTKTTRVKKGMYSPDIEYMRL